MQFKIGNKVNFNNCTFIITAFLNANNTLTSEKTEWVAITKMTDNKDFIQITVHISLLTLSE